MPKGQNKPKTKIFKAGNLEQRLALFLHVANFVEFVTNKEFQKSWNSLGLSSLSWFHFLGYYPHSVFVKELDFWCRIQKFHHSWNLPESMWNSEICPEMALFLTNLTCWYWFNLIFAIYLLTEKNQLFIVIRAVYAIVLWKFKMPTNTALLISFSIISWYKLIKFCIILSSYNKAVYGALFEHELILISCTESIK